MRHPFAIAFVLCALFAPSSGLAQGLFLTETADGSPSDVGQFTSLELDLAGNAHVTYYDSTSGDLRYASKSGGIWTIETPDAEGNVGLYTSLALTHGGHVHVGYYATTGGALKYANRIGGSWTIEVVDDPENEVGRWAALALDPTETPHIAYYDVSAGALRYASREGGGWTVMTVPYDGNMGSHASLAIDPIGTSHISCYDVSNGNLLYVTKPYGSWTWSIETADGSANDVGRYTSIVLDEGGNPHVSYYDVTAGDVRYARRTGGSWTLESPEVTPDNAGLYTSIALNEEGDPRISYLDVTAEGLKFARRGNGTWVVTTVTGYEPTPGRFTSLELDALGGPCIAFHGNDTADQLLACFSPDSLAVNGRLHVAVGDAGVDSAAGAVLVDHIGPSGQDGVMVLHEPADGFNVLLDDMNELTAFPLGAFLQVSTGATPVGALLEDDQSAVTGACRMTDIEGPTSDQRRILFTADFEDVGSQTSKLELYLEGNLVYSASGLTDTIPLQTEDWPSSVGSVLIVESRLDGVMESPGFSIQGRTVGSVLIVELGKAVAETTLDIDEIRIFAEAPVESVPSYSRFTLWAKDIPDYTIKGEELLPAIHREATTGVGVVLDAGRPLVVYPNPALGAARVLFNLSETRSVELAIFDASGRRIRSIAPGALSAGARSLAWDGRDDAGRPVAAGAYFLRLDTGGAGQTGRLMLIR